MKILHINSYYSVSKFYKNLYDKQIEQDINISVYTPISDEKLKDQDFGEYTKVSKAYSKYDRYVFKLKHNKIFKDIIEHYDLKEYDVVHAHSLFSNGYIALKLKQKYNIPYIVAIRNTDVNVFFKYMLHLRKLGIEIINEAEKVIFLSESYKNMVIEKYIPKNIVDKISNKIEVIPNGIDDFWINNKFNKNIDLERFNKKIKVVYVGVINKNKNITTTAKALDLLNKKGYCVEFDVVGKILDEKIYNEISKYEFVKYIEPKVKEELIQIYRRNDIFIMPSIYETFGLVYAEAMSQGLPVIYSKGQGFDGHFKDGEIGYSVDSLDYNEILNKIEDIIKNYEILSNKCCIKCEEFKWDYIEEKYKRMYLSIISNYKI